MKPRLEPVPLTDIDFCIFARGYRGCEILPGTPIGQSPFENGLAWGMSQRQDRRDADIMHALSHRWLGCPVCTAQVRAGVLKVNLGALLASLAT